MQDSTELNMKMYLLDGSFISGILPYVEYDSVMKHPLWGSNLIFNNEEAVVKAHRDYIRAGAEFLTTNTYQASIEGFQKYLNLNYDQSFQLIKKSVTICRRAIMEESSGFEFSVLHVFGSSNIRIKKAGKSWMSLCCTVGYKWVTVMDGIKFESNDIISLYTKNDSERR